MKALLVHQAFPSQLITPLEVLQRHGAECVGIGTGAYSRPGLRYRQYRQMPVTLTGDPALDDLAFKTSAAKGAAAAARALRYEGFTPDLIIAHPGWGEALYLKDIFPDARLICYCEYYYLRKGGEVDFDPETAVTTPDILHRLRTRNAIALASLDDADLGVAPTRWQRSTFPKEFQGKIVTAHEGIDVRGLDRVVKREPAPVDRPVVTFVARHLEPHRGFHTFLRAVPEILEASPRAQIVIVGQDTPGYGALPEGGRSWKQMMLDEVGRDNWKRRVFFTGKIEFNDYSALIARSSVHVYLTYPFVLSWSALEFASQRVPIVASGTAPVSEFFVDGDSARLVDMLAPRSIASGVAATLADPAGLSRFGLRARDMVFAHELSREQGRVAWQRILGLAPEGAR